MKKITFPFRLFSLKRTFYGLFCLSLLMLVSIQFVNAQKLTYQSRAVGNDHLGATGPHMQNHIKEMNVDKDGGCVTFSVWDEGGNSLSTYKNGQRIGTSRYTANSKVAKDLQGNTWTIKNYYGRFLFHASWFQTNVNYPYPVPTDSKAPYIQCSDGRVIREVADPSAIGINYKTGELLVADQGTDQNIKIYDVTQTTSPLIHSKEFGIKGGIFGNSTPGLMDDPLKFCGVSGLGADELGNIYVANAVVNSDQGSGGGSDLRSFKPDGTLNWRMRGYLFLNSGCVDPATNGTDVYNGFFRFHVDYSKPAGQDWTAASCNLNPFKYPNDLRLTDQVNSAFAIKYINGKKYMFCSDMYKTILSVYRFDNEIAVPCAVICAGYGWQADQPSVFHWQYTMNRPSPRWIWCDRNGNADSEANEFERFNIGSNISGMDVDNAGNIYFSSGAKVYKIGMNGIDSYGNPQYSSKWVEVFATIDHDIRSMKWVEETDIFVCGDSSMFTKVHIWKNWSKPTRQKVRSIPVPTEGSIAGHVIWPQNVTADKDYLYVTYAGPSGPNELKTGEINVYKISDGSFVGYIRPGSELSGYSGWIDMVEPTYVFVNDVGKRIITTEEDGVGKIIIYEWCPTGNCYQNDMKITLKLPVENQFISQGTDFLLKATATSDSININRIEFYKGDSLIGSTTDSVLTWQNIPAGQFYIKAKVIGNDSLVKYTQPIKVFVGDGLPLVTLGNMDSSYLDIDTVAITAKAIDYNGSIDNVQFFANDSLLETVHGFPFTYSWKMPKEGIYDITAKAFDNDMNVVVSKPISITVGGIAYRNPDNPTNVTKGGVRYKYYEGSKNSDDWGTFDSTKCTVVKAGINKQFDLSVATNKFLYAITYHGYVEVPVDGTYTFYTSSDDGSTLSIGKTLVVDNNGGHGNKEEEGRISLKAGLHEISVMYYQQLYDATLFVKYDGPGIAKQVIPDTVLYYTESLTGLNNLLENKGIMVFPNPLSAGELTISGVKINSMIKISNIMGTVVYSVQAHAGDVIINDLKLSKGMYIIEVSDGEYTAIKKLLVQ